MKKLTADQRHYRKRKRMARRDFILVPRPNSDKKSVKVTRRALCIRVSVHVFELLDRLCEHYKKTKQDMVTHMINHSIEKYQSDHRGRARLKRYDWPENLINSIPETRRYARHTDKQLNLRITSTAYKKLQCACVDLNYSKKRLVQQLVMSYSSHAMK